MPRLVPRRIHAFAATLLLAAGPAGALSEFGIEGMHVVSTPASERHASVSPDGQWIVWDSPDRRGGPGGGDLWRARLRAGRWSDAAPLPVDTPAREADPAFSADGRWLYFASDRAGGPGGTDLYRAPVGADGALGAAEPLGAGVNGPGNERAPAPSRDGDHLLFASDRGGATGLDLFVARLDAGASAPPVALAEVNTAADESDGAWLGDGRALVFARGHAHESRLQVAQCVDGRYAGATPLALSFNVAGQRTDGAVLDWHAPGELLVSGTARAPRAGGSDVYRMRAPAATGGEDCVARGRAGRGLSGPRAASAPHPARNRSAPRRPRRA